VGSEANYLKLLKRADLPPETLERLLADRSARRYHAVRLALAAHPRTPRREALSLVATLFWRDLAHLSADVRVHPEVRRAADRDLLRRLPEMALAERKMRDIDEQVRSLHMARDRDPNVLATDPREVSSRPSRTSSSGFHCGLDLSYPASSRSSVGPAAPRSGALLRSGSFPRRSAALVPYAPGNHSGVLHSARVWT
jgi:hypothetical protein